MAETSPRSKSRFRVLIGVLITLIVIYLLAPLLQRWTDNQRKLDKVKLGMNIEQVEAILGRPGRTWSDILQESKGFTEVEYTDPADRYLYWKFNDGTPR